MREKIRKRVEEETLMRCYINLGELASKARGIWLVGSRVTCNPPPKDTDRDWLVLVPEIEYTNTLDYYEQHMLKGWEPEGSLPTDTSFNINGDEKFRSFRKGDNNVILTTDEDFYLRFIAATSVAQRLNLLRKEDRIALFQAVLYGNPCW